MFSGPLFRREYQAATRRRLTFVFRTVFAVVLAIVAVLIGLIISTANSGDSTPERLIYLGRSLFIATISIELQFLLALVPAYVGGAIAEEREKDTLPSLLLTRLTPIEIVLTKTVARWWPTISPILIGLPALVMSAWLAGLEAEMVLALLVLLSSSAFMASLAILASAQREQAGTARAQAMAWIFGWLLGPPILTIMPIRTISPLGNLVADLKALCALVAPSSPISLVTNPVWYFQPRVSSLEQRVALMIGLQVLFGLLALGFAASRLKARETNPNWLDPTRGYRPPCGDDPIYWREYELPMRRGGGSLFVLRLRYVSILVRALLMNLLALVMTLLALAVPIGLVVTTMYYGYAAFEELWQYGYGLNGPFNHRSDFNWLVRAATGLLGLLPAMSETSLVSTRIISERNRKTWDILLTTPLSGREILWSKSRVAIQGLWQTTRPLIVIWILALACGVVVPLGVVLAAVDLLLVAWVFLALGLHWSIQPGLTTTVASSRTTSSTLIVLLIHAPLLAALLATPRELAEFNSWGNFLRGGLMLAGPTVMIVTGMVAWFSTRRTLDRFDEWVGRPYATGEVQGEAAARMNSDSYFARWGSPALSSHPAGLEILDRNAD